MSFQMYSVLCVLMFVCRTNSIITPPAPIPMPVEGGDFEIRTPPPPIIMELCADVECLDGCVSYQDENGCKQCKCRVLCDEFICNVDEICIREEGKGAHCGSKKDEKAVCKETTDCRLDCRYGLKQDLNGCDKCSCLEPCKGVECGEGMECNIEMVNEKLLGVCSPISKCMKNYCELKCEDGFASNNNNCPVCACSDPCKDMNCLHGCEKVQKSVSKKSKWMCKASPCASEDCSKWCRMKGMHDLGLDSNQKKCSMCNCNNRCLDVSCGDKGACRLEEKQTCYADMCYTYQHPICQEDKCAKMECKFQCFHGYETDREGCPTCDCKPDPDTIFLSTFKPPYPSPTPDPKYNFSPIYSSKPVPLFTNPPTSFPSYECKGICEQDYFCAVISSGNVCLPCPLKCDKSCLYGVEGGVCASCVCKPNPCDLKKCDFGDKCFPTFRNDNEVSDHVCLDRYTSRQCSQVTNLINKNDSVYNNYNNHYNNFFRYNYNYNFNQDLECSEYGRFKEVQLVNDVVVCIKECYGGIEIKENCRPYNMLKINVRVDKDNQLTTIRKRISEKLQKMFSLSEEFVIVSKMHRSNGDVQGNVLLVVKEYKYRYHYKESRLNAVLKVYHNLTRIHRDAPKVPWLQISGLETLLMPSTTPSPTTPTTSYFYYTDPPYYHDNDVETYYQTSSRSGPLIFFLAIFVAVLVLFLICAILLCWMRVRKARYGNSCRTIPAPAYLDSDFNFSKLKTEKDWSTLKGVTNC